MGIPFYGAIKKVNVFECFIDGAKQGFNTSVSLIPYLIGMLVAIGMLRASGFFELLAYWFQPFFSQAWLAGGFITLGLGQAFCR